MMQKTVLTQEEQLAEYERRKAALLSTYRNLKEDLEYAVDNVEEGLIKAKRGKLALQIKSLSAKIGELESEESSA